MERINTEIINDIAKTINANPAELGLTKTSSLKKKVGILLDVVTDSYNKQFKIIDDYNYKKELVHFLFDSSEKEEALDLINRGIALRYEAIEGLEKINHYLSSQYINLKF